MERSHWNVVTIAALAAVSFAGDLRAQETENAEAAEPVPAVEAVIPESDEAREAASAAEAWLRILDDKDYEQAWTEASSVLQNAASPQVLKNSIKTGRRGLDSLVSRTLISWEEIRNPVGAMPGDYVVLAYRTIGKNNWSVVETVIPRRDDGEWRVSGYLVKRE